MAGTQPLSTFWVNFIVSNLETYAIKLVNAMYSSDFKFNFTNFEVMEIFM